MRKLFSAFLALCLFATVAVANNVLLNPYRFGGGSPPASLAIADTATPYIQDTAGTSHDLTLPPNIASGNLLLLVVCINSAPTVTDPSGFTSILSRVNTDTFRVYAKIATGSEGGTINLGTGNNQRVVSAAYRITGNRNGVTSSEIEISSAVDATTANPDPPSLTPTWGSAENLWIPIQFSVDGNYTLTGYPSNYTLGQLSPDTVAGSAGCGFSMAGRLLTATSEDPGQFTTDTSRARSSYTLAIRPQ